MCSLLGLSAVSLLLAGELGAAAKSAYFRVRVSPECTLYGLAREDELRFSATPEGLAAVTPIKAAKTDTADLENGGVFHDYTYPEVTLAVPPDQLPPGFSSLKIRLQHGTIRNPPGARGRDELSYVHGQLGLCREDQDGAEWSYWCWVGSETGSRPRKAPVIQAPEVTSLTLKITTDTQKQDEVGIAVQVMAGETALSNVERGDTSAQVHLRVLDSADKVVASEKGPLSEFGFT